MTNIPPPINTPISQFDAVLQALLYDVGVKAAVIECTALMPWLGLPIISGLFTFLVSKVAGMIYTQLETFVAFRMIDFQTSAETQAYDDAKTQLLSAINSGDPNAITQAKTNFSTAAFKLIHFDGQ
jgi:hypothetical protein